MVSERAHSRSLEPTLIVWLPMTSFLCSIVTVGLLRTVFEITGNSCKIFPLYTFNVSAEWVPLGILLRLRETSHGKSLTMCIRFDTIPESDGQTDGRTD